MFGEPVGLGGGEGGGGPGIGYFLRGGDPTWGCLTGRSLSDYLCEHRSMPRR